MPMTGGTYIARAEINAILLTHRMSHLSLIDSWLWMAVALSKFKLFPDD